LFDEQSFRSIQDAVPGCGRLFFGFAGHSSCSPFLYIGKKH
jgi:hypothetical protein